MKILIILNCVIFSLLADDIATQNNPELDIMMLEIERDGLKSKIYLDTNDNNTIIQIDIDSIEAVNKIEEKEIVPDKTRHGELIDSYISKGRIELNKRNYQLALNYFRRALELNPDNTSALALSGTAYFKLDDLNSARSCWQEALDLDPNLIEVDEVIRWLDSL